MKSPRVAAALAILLLEGSPLRQAFGELRQADALLSQSHSPPAAVPSIAPTLNGPPDPFVPPIGVEAPQALPAAQPSIQQAGPPSATVPILPESALPRQASVESPPGAIRPLAANHPESAQESSDPQRLLPRLEEDLRRFHPAAGQKVSQDLERALPVLLGPAGLGAYQPRGAPAALPLQHPVRNKNEKGQGAIVVWEPAQPIRGSSFGGEAFPKQAFPPALAPDRSNGAETQKKDGADPKIQLWFASAYRGLGQFKASLNKLLSKTLLHIPVYWRIEAAAAIENISRWATPPRTETRGVGSSPIALMFAVGYGGVRPPEPIKRGELKRSAPYLQALESVRRNTPFVLTGDQLRKLQGERASPSNTLTKKTGPGTDISMQNFERAAWKVNQWAAQGEDLTQEKIVELNRILLMGTPRGSYAGAVRDSTHVGHRKDKFGSDFFYYAHPKHVARYLDDFMTWYGINSRRMPPIQLAAMAYQQLVRVHPFHDANGRTTRLVMDFILQRNGYPPAVFPKGVFPEAVHARTASVIETASLGVFRAERLLGRQTPSLAGDRIIREGNDDFPQ